MKMNYIGTCTLKSYKIFTVISHTTSLMITGSDFVGEAQIDIPVLFKSFYIICGSL